MAILSSHIWRARFSFDSLAGMRSIGRVLLVIAAIVTLIVFFTCISTDKKARHLPSKNNDVQTAIMLSDPTDSQQAVSVDPYADHDQWCEDIYKTVCSCADSSETVCDPIDPQTGETKPCANSRTGRPQICLRPHWARRQGISHHECTPQWLTKKQQNAKKEDLRVIIEDRCELPAWAQELGDWGKENGYGSDASKLCWHLKGGDPNLKTCKTGHFCDPDKLYAFMRIPPRREVAWDHESAHELDLDKAANQRSYEKMRRYYEGNPHYSNADRWGVGYGWYGHNAALHTQIWDKMAPPEILCRPVESTEVHLRKMRHSFKKLYQKYGDDKERAYELDTGEKITVKGVTWYDLHRAASSGKMFPADIIKTRRWSKKKQKWVKIGFVSRAKSKRVGLDPFETIMWEWLGEPIPRDRQNQIADQIRRKIDGSTKSGGGNLSSISP